MFLMSERLFILSEFSEIVSESIPISDNMVYNSSIKRLNEEELEIMDRDGLIEVIGFMLNSIYNKESLQRIYNVVSRLLKKEAGE